LAWPREDDGGRPCVRRPDGGTAEVQLREDKDAPAPVVSIELGFPGATAAAKRAKNGDFYLIDFTSDAGNSTAQMRPAGRDKISDILLSELGRVGRHPLYWPAIRAIEPLIGRR
ncbi:MAG: hypothetical protein ACKOEI_03505, partial [Chthoniobacterales bacterium]